MEHRDVNDFTYVSVSELTLGVPKPITGVGLRRLRSAELERVASAQSHQRMLQEENSEQRRRRKVSLLDGNSASKQALFATRSGVVNVTRRQFSSKVLEQPIISVQSNRLQRRASIIITLYLSILSMPIIEYIVAAVNASMGHHHHSMPFTIAEVECILRMHTELINNWRFRRRKDYLASKRRMGYFRDPKTGKVGFVTEHRYRMFVNNYSPNEVGLFTVVSKSFLRNLNTWPTHTGWIFLAADESMAGWESPLHYWVVYIPRKPVPEGIRIYIVATILTATGRPIAIWLLPDLPEVHGQRFFSPKTVMEKVAHIIIAAARQGILPHNSTVTMDALFCYPDMLKMWLSYGIFGSVGLKQNEFVKALAYDLKRGHHRVFQHGDLLISVFHDNKMVVTASTVFNCSKVVHVMQARPLFPLFTQDMLFILQLAGCTKKLQDDLRMLGIMIGARSASTNPDTVLATATHMSTTHLQSILAHNQPTPDLLAAMSAFVEHHQRLANGASLDEGDEDTPQQCHGTTQRRRMGPEDRQRHLQLINILKARSIEGVAFTVRQKVVTKAQLKRIASKLGISFHSNIKLREEMLAYVLSSLVGGDCSVRDGGGNGETRGSGEPRTHSEVEGITLGTEAEEGTSNRRDEEVEGIGEAEGTAEPVRHKRVEGNSEAERTGELVRDDEVESFGYAEGTGEIEGTGEVEGICEMRDGEEYEISVDVDNLPPAWKRLLPTKEDILSEYGTIRELQAAIQDFYPKAKVSIFLLYMLLVASYTFFI